MILTYIYRDPKRVAWAKKIHIQGFIKDKEYDLIKGKQGKIDKFWHGDAHELVHLKFVPAKRQRIREDWFDMENLDVCGLAARGTKMAAKPVQTIKLHKRS